MSQPRPLLSPPETEEQLLAQAQQLSGYTLGENWRHLSGWLRQRI